MANSTQTADSDGTLELLALSFDYLDRSEISVYFDNIPTTAWEWVGTADKTIKFVPVVPNGVQVLVRRTTDSSELRHQYSLGAAFDAATLDESLAQILHIVQEAQEANLSADFYGPLNMHGNKIAALQDGVDDYDVANVRQVVALSAPSVTAAATSASAAATSAAAAAASATSAGNSATAAAASATAAAATVSDTIKKDGSVAMTAELPLSGAASGSSSATPLSQVQSLIAAAVAAAVPPGTISAQARLATADGWLLVDGKTIGNASSGATARANADTWALFEQVWAFSATAVPIYTNTGAASTRGASAALDFADGKRLALFTPNGGAFLRMYAPGQTVDSGRVPGTVQDAYAGYNHFAVGVDDGDSQTASLRSLINLQVNGQTIGDSNPGSMDVPVIANDAHPYNLSMPHYIKL